MSTTHHPQVARILADAPQLCALLQQVAALGLPEGCIAAGMVRNAVWDVLHGRPPTLHPHSDVDVIYFDRADCDSGCETRLEAALSERRPDIPWQVRNQARMHLRNGDPPYESACDALRYFPETATAISARWEGGAVVIDAPLGVDDLFALVIRPTPSFERRMPTYRERLAGKDWAQRWPHLRFEAPDHG